jgi:thiamine-phosphate pyrophosphorylase
VSAGLAPGRLCLVSDRRRLAAAAGTDVTDAPALLVEQAAAASACDVGVFQVREPDLTTDALLTLAAAVRAALGPATRLLVNDRADVAAAADAGVHLKERSMPAARVRTALPSVRPIWRAVHDADGARNAGPVDALVAGTVLATRSKPTAAPTLGLDGLAAIVAATALPVYAIGGLTGASWRSVSASGAYGCAAIGVFLPRSGEDIASAMRRAVRGFADGVD